jgi:superfamily I DNA/RNA helicase
MTPTEQQLYCVAIAQSPEPMVKIEACAGAGKTSTLVLIAKSVLEDSIYMAFNKVTAMEAAEKFPGHVTCQTTHSLAFAAFGRPLMNKLSRPKGAYKNVAGTGSEIAKYYKLCSVDVAGQIVATANAVGVYVKRTVERFEQSADMKMTIKNVPLYDMEKLIEADRNIGSYVLKAAQKLWKDRIDVRSDALATHDTYLKLYQLSKPVLPFEVLYLDEAQDTTPCVLDIVMNQKHMKIILVGDRRQAIYGWRGANNAMSSMDCAVAPLSMSFRYGKGIAKVATAVLAMDMIIDGREDLESIVGYNKVDRTKPYMYLFRTNAVLLDEAVAAIDGGEKIKVEVDTKDFVKILQSAQALHDGYLKNIKHEKILPYANWKALVEEAKEIGGELKRVAAIIDGDRSEHIISVLEHYVAPSDALATYTTAHKAKGREADQVILADDFPSHYDKFGEWKPLPEAEQNLLYVAVTRSQRVLEINKSVAEVMTKYKIDLTDPEWYDTEFFSGEDNTEYFFIADNYDLLAKEAKEVNRIIFGD